MLGLPVELHFRRSSRIMYCKSMLPNAGMLTEAGFGVAEYISVAQDQSCIADNEQRDCETRHKDIRVAMPAISLDHGYLQERGKSCCRQN